MMKIEKGSRLGLTACSNGQQEGYKGKIEYLTATLEKMGYRPVYTDCIFEKDSYFSGTGKERAEALMNFYLDLYLP